MILEKTINLVKNRLEISGKITPTVNKVVIGLGYTGVEILSGKNSSFLGLAYTLPEVLNRSTCSKIDFAGSLTKLDIIELLYWALNDPGIEKVIGIATLNALSQYLISLNNPYKELEGELFEVLKINSKSSVTFIGFIKPLIREAHQYTKNITLIERNLDINNNFKKFNFYNNVDELNASNFNTSLLLITGTSIINGTLEKILNKFTLKSDFIGIIGPSAGLLPDILFKSGVDLVGGMMIKDNNLTLRSLQEGGGTKFFKKFGRKYNFIK